MLSSWGIEFEPVNIIGNPQAQEELKLLGVPMVPATVVDGRAVHGWNPAALADLLKVPYQEQTRLPPAELATRLDAILTASQTLVSPMSLEAMELRSPGRGRSLRELCFHVFRLGGAFVDTMEQGFHKEEWLNERPPTAMRTGAHLAGYGATVRDRLSSWFAVAATGVFAESVDTYYGPQIVHELLERTTWHAAHHLRQVHDLAHRAGALSGSDLDEGLFAGLPMPGELW